MFGLLNKRLALRRLYKKYKSLLQDSKRLAPTNFQLSEQKALEASGIMQQIEILRSRN
ncbi:MAG: Lacal_2735 family protein [Balneolaceae bacterium]